MTVTCIVCNENFSKYKCSTCIRPYCSLNCWKTHKTQNCEVEKPNVTNTNNISGKTKYFTEDTVHENKLKQLGESVTLRKILSNKYLQSTLTALDQASDPEPALKTAMKDPEFIEFVDECLKIVEGPND